MHILGIDDTLVLIIISLAVVGQFVKSHPRESIEGIKFLSRYFKK